MFNVAISFMAGIVVFKFSPCFPVSIFISVAISILLLFRGVGYLPFVSSLKVWDRAKADEHVEIYKKKIAVVFIFVFALGYGALRHEEIPEIQFPESKVSVSGTVIELQSRYDNKGYIILKDVTIDGAAIKGKIRLGSTDSAHLNDFNYGDRISAHTRLKAPVSFNNPGIYSYNLRARGISGIGFTDYIRVIGRGSGLLSSIDKMRQELGGIIDNSLSTEAASLNKAIIPGLKRGIVPLMRENFASTGLAHLLSISGTHFGLLAFIFFSFFRSVFKFLPEKVLTVMTNYITPSQMAVICTLPFLILYALISGMSVPTIRSLIMVTIFMSALLLGRRGQWLNSLSIAALLILLWHPDTLFSVSFQLSFLAVLSIGYMLEQRGVIREDYQPSQTVGQDTYSGKSRIRSASLIYEKLKTSILLTISAIIGTAPLIVILFKQFPLISPVTNIVVTPLICFIVLPLGLLTSVISLVLDLDSMPLSGLTESITVFALKTIDLFAGFRYSSVHLHNPSIVMIFCYYLSVLFIYKGRSRYRFLPLLIVLIIYLAAPYIGGDGLRVSFLDVGQGDSTVLELPDNKVMLIDGGTGDPDIGRVVIAPFLRSRGIERIDYMVISHPHFDHYGGLGYILNNFTVGEIWFNGRIIEGSEAFFGMAKEKGVFIRRLARGDIIKKDKNYSVSVLHPYDDFFAFSPRGDFSDQNSDSLVLKVESEGLTFLFTGDIEREAEEDLLYLERWLKADILKVPHHGGRTSSSENFIAAVAPDVAVISAGRYNRFKHPHKETLDRYRSAGVRIYRTDIDGAVTIVKDNGKYSLMTYRDSRYKRVEGWRDEARNLRLLFSEL